MEKMKIKGNEVYYLSEYGNVAIAYSQFDFGEKWKIYRKVKYGENVIWKYVNSFVEHYQAVDYAKKIYDVLVEE